MTPTTGLCDAVAPSPHETGTHGSSPEPKSIQRGDGSSRATIAPARRHNTGFETWRIAVRRVPCDALCSPRSAMTSEAGRSNVPATYAARQSLGTTSKPAPGTAVIRARHFDFARDIDVVRLRSQACAQHWRGGSREWTRHVHNTGNVCQGFTKLLGVIEPDRACRQTQPIAQPCQRTFVAARENNIEFFFGGECSGEASRITVSSVQQQPRFASPARHDAAFT